MQHATRRIHDRRHFHSAVLAPVLTTLALSAMAVGCGDGTQLAPESPSMSDIAGVYNAGDEFGALSFTTTSDGQTTDWLAAGAELVITLGDDGTTTGHLFVPGGDDDGGDLDADLAGTWSLSGQTVTFDQEADTFVRDMPFTFNDGTLTGDKTWSGVRVQVVLVRQ